MTLASSGSFRLALQPSNGWRTSFGFYSYPPQHDDDLARMWAPITGGSEVGRGLRGSRRLVQSSGPLFTSGIRSPGR